MRTLGLILLVVLSAADDVPAAIGRDQDPVLVSGTTLPALSGRNVADLALFRYDPGTASFVPIPFQVDERVDHRFNPGTTSEFVETLYDIFGEDDGLLDGDDELAFLFGDAGPLAPAAAPWVVGADATRYELVVTDPRPPVSYLAWSGSASGDVGSSSWWIDFSDRWVLDGYRVLPPCVRSATFAARRAD